MEQQRVEFAKYTKFFTIRLVQAVVQSRLGEKSATNCRLLAERNDWFNLKIEEYGEITNEINKATEGQFPPECSCISIEFQLQTCDGEKLPLECWALRFDAVAVDENIAIRGNFYHQLGTLLKSTLAASRVTPSYRNYVRRQGPDSFVVCYRIFRGEPDVIQLGDGYRSVRLGHLPSPFGSLYWDLHYRTNMVISSGGTTALVLNSSLKENYYEEKSPEKNVQKLDDENFASLDTKSQPFAPVPLVGSLESNHQNSPSETCFSTFSTSPASMELPWFGAGGIGENSPARRPSVGFQMGQTSDSSSESSANWPNKSDSGGLSKNNSSGTLFKMDLSSGSFPKPSSLPERCAVLEENKEARFPFSALLTASSVPTVTRAATDSQLQKLNASMGQLDIVRVSTRPGAELAPKAQVLISPAPSPIPNLNEVDNEEDSSDDSFVKVDINPLFSTSPEKDASDLGSLVRAFKFAPPQLHSFDDESGPSFPNVTAISRNDSGVQSSNSVGSLTGEIQKFQEQQNTFDSFLKSLKEQQGEDEEEG